MYYCPLFHELFSEKYRFIFKRFKKGEGERRLSV